MKKTTQQQLRLEWAARPVLSPTEDEDAFDDPLADAINKLLDAYWMFECMGDDICMDIILRQVQEQADRWLDFANQQAREWLQQRGGEA
jgi:hypothetical protein